MGRPRIGKEYKKPSDYKYDFPEQRELSEGLHWGDMSMIAKKAGLSTSYVSEMAAGTKKMTDDVRDLILKYAEINELKQAI